MGTSKYSLSTILFSQVRQRVLSLLYVHPDNSYHTKEIIRLVNSGAGAVQRELEALTAVGLINVQLIGNQKRYSANISSILYSELRGIVLKTFGLADVLLEELAPVASQVKISFVYGSIAKQEDTSSSDIDLMIIGNKLTYSDLFMLLEKAQARLGRSINPTFYSAEDWQRKIKAGNNFLIQVIKQKKIFLIGSEDELSKFR